jgi:hypothetical protein
VENRIAHHRSEMMERARQSTYRSQQKPHGTILNLCSSQRNQNSEVQAESQHICFGVPPLRSNCSELKHMNGKDLFLTLRNQGRND